jgi:diguanylate cyclase (GGDEF)-like protein
VVRYGGEEFLVVLPETSLDGARELAERIRAACAARRVDCGKLTLGATASFGVVGADFADGAAIAARDLIAAADERMYEAKRAGRNRVVARPFVAP